MDEDFDCPDCGSDNIEYSFPLINGESKEKAICRYCNFCKGCDHCKETKQGAFREAESA